MPESLASGILKLLVDLVPAGVSPGVRRVVSPHPPLRPDEALLTSRMSPIRLQEFSAGRAAARDALSRLGKPGTSILVGPGRVPKWPTGFVGSITHTATLAAAVVAETSRIRSLGLDAEEQDALEAQLLPVVCRPEELARLTGDSARASTAKLIFSAKEAAYKCLSPLTGIFLEFQDLEIRLRPENQSFSVLGHGSQTLHMPLAQLRGRYGTADGMIVTVCWLAAEISGTPRGEDGAAGYG